MTPTEWARNIKAPLDLAGMIMHLAARADESGTVRCKMLDLCELFMCDRSTIYRYLAHLDVSGDGVGVLRRETKRGGPNQDQVLVLQLTDDPRLISRRIRVSKTHTHRNSRRTATVDGQTVATNRRDVATVAGTVATNRGDVATVSHAPPGSPVLVSSSGDALNTKESLTLGGVNPVIDTLRARVRAREAPVEQPASTLLPLPVTLSETDISEIVHMLRHKDPDGEDGVRFRIRSFLANDSADRWRRDPKQGALNWCERDYASMRRSQRQQPAAAMAPDPPPRKSEFERFEHGYRNY